MNTQDSRKWYVATIASTYLVVCSASCLHSVAQLLRQNGASPEPMPLLISFGMAIAAGAYFFKPKVGHLALLIFTSITLLAIGTTDPIATLFHVLVLLALGVPLLRAKKKRIIGVAELPEML
jgi:hypothetical protein